MKSSISQFIVGLLVGGVVCCVLFAWIGQKEGDRTVTGSRTLTVAHSLSVNHPVHKGLEEFGRELLELSGGSMHLKIFPSEQLGNETECLEKVQQGTIDITKVSAAPIGNFVPVFKLFSLPYLFRDGGHYWKTLDGEIGESLLATLGTNEDGSANGLVGLGYFDSGSRSFYTTKPVNSPKDLEGMKIRVMQDPVSEDTVKSMGASAITMSFGELYTSLKQGGVDGAENNPPSLLTSRHFEICKYYILDQHSRIPDVLVAGAKLWDELGETERGWIREAARRSSIFQRKLWAEETQRSLDELKESGVKIIKADQSLFRKKSASVVTKYATGARKEIVDRIQQVEK